MLIKQLQGKGFKLGLPSSQVCILMEDGNHWTMLHWYYTTCSYNLEISDLVITDSLNVDRTVSCLNDVNVCTCYTTICAMIDEGTGFVSSVIANTVVRHFRQDLSILLIIFQIRKLKESSQ